MVITIAHTRLGRGGDGPMRLKVPPHHEFNLFMHAASCRLSSHDAAQHAIRRRQACPGPFCQSLDMLQKLRPMRQQGSPGAVIFIHGPLQTGVANVYRQKCHAADYQYFSPLQAPGCNIHYLLMGNCQKSAESMSCKESSVFPCKVKRLFLPSL